MNDILKVIKERYSCRNYSGQRVEKEKLLAIGDAALRSPSSRNTQHWKIYIIDNKDLLDEMDIASLEMFKESMPDLHERIMGRGGKVFYNAPSMFLILATPDAHGEVALDCGIVSQTIALAAKSLGLDTVIVRMGEFPFVSPKGEAFKERVGWKDGYTFGMAVLCGYENVKTGEPHAINPDKLVYVE